MVLPASWPVRASSWTAARSVRGRRAATCTVRSPASTRATSSASRLDASADDDRATLVTITGAGRELFGRLLPGHVQVTRRLLFDSLSEQDTQQLGDIMTRARDHMRAQPPRSAAPRRPLRRSPS
jgi:hypothetical protein